MPSLTPPRRRQAKQSRTQRTPAPSSSAEEIARRLQAKVKGGTLVLTGRDAESAELDFVMDGAFSLGSITVIHPTIEAKLTTLTIRGNVELMSLDGSRIAITIDYAGPELTLALNRPRTSAPWPGVEMGLTALTFHFAKKKWDTSGTVDVVLFGTALSLHPLYQAGKTKRFRFLLHAETAPVRLDVAPIGSLGLDTVELERRQVQQEKPSWGFGAHGELQLDAIPQSPVNLTGTVSIPPPGSTAGIGFQADKGSSSRVTLRFHDFGLPDPPPRLVLGLDKLTLGKMKAGWTLDAGVQTRFAGMPSFLTRPIPGTAGSMSLLPKEPRNWHLSISAERFQLSVDRLWDAGGIEATLPTVNVHGAGELPLGVLWMDATDWTITLTHQGEASLSVKLKALASRELNRMFGVRADKKSPRYVVFKTYERKAEREKDAVRLSFQMSTGAGIAAELLDSPITNVDFIDGWWYVTLGNPKPEENFGKFRFKSPKFQFDAKRESFEVFLEYEIIEPLEIPLTPFKAALEAAGLGAVADRLPDAEPLTPIAIVTKDEQGNDHLNAHELLNLIERIPKLTPAVRKAVVRALQKVDGFLQRTPGNFNDYLTFALPKSLYGSLAVAPGGATVDIRTDPVGAKKRTPLRLLLPGLDPVFGPELNGIELYGISLGAAAGGAVEVLKLDARMDRFDLITFILCQIAGKTLHGKSVKELRRRYVFDQVLALIPAGAPVPIPIFFGALGIEYVGWDGFGFETRWGFKEPDLGFLNLLQAGKAVYQFLTASDYFFKPKQKAPAGLDLPLDLGPNTIQLPKYLGGALLGSKSTTHYPLWQSLANLLNFCKRGELEDLLNVFPLEIRVGAADAALGPLEIRGAYALTTPEEFTGPRGRAVVQVLTKALGYAPDGRLLDILPQSNGTPHKGLVSLLFGQLVVGKALRLTGGYATVAVSGRSATWQGGDDPQPSGMATVALFSGGAGSLDVTLQGELGVSAAGRFWIGLAADLLVLNGRPLLSGATCLDIGTDGLTADVRFTVTDSFGLGGSLTISKDVLAIGGDVSWRYAQGLPEFSAQGGVSLSKQGFAISFKSGPLYGVSAHGSGLLGLDGKTKVSLGVDISKNLTDAFYGRLKSLPQEIEGEYQTALGELEKALQAYNWEVSLHGFRQAIPQFVPAVKGKIGEGIDRYIDKSSAIPGPVKGAAKSWARSWARDNVFPKLDTLKRIAAKGDDAALRSALQSALQEVRDINKMAIPVKIPLRKKPVANVPLKGTLSPEQVNTLGAAIQAVGRIPAKETTKKNTEAAKNLLQERLSEFRGIAQRIAAGALDKVPRLSSISLENDLSTLSSNYKVQAVVYYSGNYTVGLDFDLSHPAASVPAIATAFSKMYPSGSRGGASIAHRRRRASRRRPVSRPGRSGSSR